MRYVTLACRVGRVTGMDRPSGGCESHRVSLRLAAAFALVLAGLAGCSSNDDEAKQLPTGDTAVCNAAHAGNARTVYNVRSQPTDTTLKEQANRIYPGSSNKNDVDVLKKLNDRCRDIGYSNTG